jgi:aconitate hydratase 2/2-methylisocitrate dehydratase
MLIAEKGTMGVGSSRMSGVNNVALWTGKSKSLCSFHKYC